MYARRRSPWSVASGGIGEKGGIHKSEDGGRTFRRLTEGLPRKAGRVKLLRPEAKEGPPAFRFNWDSPFVISHHDPDVLYLAPRPATGFHLLPRGGMWGDNQFAAKNPGVGPGTGT